MPIELLSLKNGGIIYKGSGVVQNSDIFPLDDNNYSTEENIKRIRYQIVDLLDVTDFNLTTAEMQRLANQDSEAIRLNPGMRIAVVAKDELAFGMNRMYQAFIEFEYQDNVNVFTDMREAEEWVKQDSVNI